MKISKYYLFITLLSISGTLFGNTSADTSNTFVSGNIKKAHHEKEFGKAPSKYGRNIPPSAGINANKRAISLSGSYTLWQVFQTGITIADVGNASAVPAANITPSNPPRSGLKVRGGKHLFYDNWEATISYTWFYNPATMQNNGYTSTNNYTSPWINLDYQNLTNITSRFFNQFNRIEFQLYRQLKYSPQFIITTWLGLQGVWEDQSLDADMNIIAEEDLFFTMRNTQDWWCIGPYAGTKVILPIFKYFSLFTNLGTGVNLVKRNVTQLQEIAPLSDHENTTVIYNTTFHEWNAEPMIEAYLGASSSHNFGSVTCYANISWQLQTWFSHNGFLPAFKNTGIYGNYSMQGLTATVGAYF